MKEIHFPYGKTRLSHSFSEDELAGVLCSSIESYMAEASGVQLVKNALEAPVGSERLCELAKNKEKIVIIASDHTRPVPSKVIMPAMLAEIRKGNPDAHITILIATGCHRGTTKEELIGKFGEDIVKNENIYIHDCDEKDKLATIGTLPSGGNCEINTIALDADLLISEGFIEPHFFAGFSGGRKSVLPGIAGRSTVLANHCSEFINHPNARTGILDDNPIHEDMLWAAKTAKLKFIVNVVLNSEKEVIYAVAGDPERAHKKGTEFLSSLCGVDAIDADIVISTNGGYPLDQNIYQAVKGMTAAEATVKKDGVIIMLASSADGTGGEHFYHQLADEEDISKTMSTFLARKRGETLPDQWQSQILVRILMHARVIYVSEMDDQIVEKMHMVPAHSIEEALLIAKELVKTDCPKIVAIPDGVAVMVKR
ncbi:MAG: nickel-dependent lactate racemase [Ruminococcaceae bacterium]|nr:nickel-dependent lactate racemase [Oscillospiraceae bacterium]